MYCIVDRMADLAAVGAGEDRVSCNTAAHTTRDYSILILGLSMLTLCTVGSQIMSHLNGRWPTGHRDRDLQQRFVRLCRRPTTHAANRRIVIRSTEKPHAEISSCHLEWPARRNVPIRLTIEITNKILLIHTYIYAPSRPAALLIGGPHVKTVKPNDINEGGKIAKTHLDIFKTTGANVISHQMTSRFDADVFDAVF
jgi:hypothetical protein